VYPIYVITTFQGKTLPATWITTINTLVDRIGMSVRVDLDIEVNVVG
jgi:hypothetical protein